MVEDVQGPPRAVSLQTGKAVDSCVVMYEL